MFDVVAENLAVLFSLLAIMWVIQIWINFFPNEKIYQTLKNHSPGRLTSVGMSGSKYKGRTYGVLTVDKNNMIIHAEKMSGWTNFSNLRAVPDLVGLTTDQILDDKFELPVSRINYF